MGNAAEFLDLIDSVQADASNAVEAFNKMVGGDGKSIRSLSERAQANAARKARYEASLCEAATFLKDIVTGRRPAYLFQEAMSTSDFPLLFGDIVDRSVLGSFSMYPTTYQNWTRAKVQRDFKTTNIFAIDGADDTLTAVPQGTEYPETKLSESKYTVNVSKFGKRLPFTWETIVNDDLDALTDIPRRFGMAAARSREKAATKMLLNAGLTDIDTNFFKSANNNLVATNPALTVDGINKALTTLNMQKDANGEPIVIEGYELLVPAALWATADNIVNTTEYRTTDVTGNTRIVRGSGIGGTLRVNKMAYLGTLNTHAKKDGTWFLAANPQYVRPAFMFATLRGHETPETFMKDPDSRRVGGGDVNPLDGDFDTDSIHYKVRDVIGTAQIDPKMVVVSYGS